MPLSDSISVCYDQLPQAHPVCYLDTVFTHKLLPLWIKKSATIRKYVECRF
jgi:hypothetical protein